MALIPRVLYTAACDHCGTVYQDPETDTPGLFFGHDRPLRHTLTAEGWLVGHRLLCPDDAARAIEQDVHRMEIEATHDPLFPLPRGDR